MTVSSMIKHAIVALTVLFGVQFALAYRLNPPDDRIAHASWAQNPQSMAELMGYASDVVRGRVVRVRRGSDITVSAPPEEGGADRIPVEVVTIQVQRRYSQGQGRPETIEVFHTGLSKGEAPWEKPDRPPGQPPQGMERPTLQVDKSPAGARTVILAGDPPYERGEEYVLALRAGPDIQVGGQRVRTVRPVSPEGRFRVRGGRVEPMLDRANFARQLRGRPVEDLEQAVQRGLANPSQGRPPWAARGGVE